MDDIAWMNEPEAAKALVYNMLNVTRILSPTGMEREMTAFCNEELIKCGFETHIDTHGNIMAIRGRDSQDKFILLNSHMDTVPINRPRSRLSLREEYVKKRNDILTRRFGVKCRYVSEGKALIRARDHYDTSGSLSFESREMHELYDQEHKQFQAELEDLERFVKDNEKNTDVWVEEVSNPWEPQRIVYNPSATAIEITEGRGEMYMGGDDKAGVAMILTIAQLTDCPLKILFTVSEEEFDIRVPDPDDSDRTIRVSGVHTIPPDFYDDVAFDLTLDKGEGNLLVPKISGKLLCGEDLVTFILHVSEIADYPLKVVEGLRCDALYIRDHVPAVNMSTGYHNPHRPNDYVNIIESHNMMALVRKIITEYNATKPVFDRIKKKKPKTSD